MNDYDELVDLVRKTVREINRYAPGKIDQVLEEEWDFNEEQFEAWQKLTLGVCYDKKYCSLLEVDYLELPKKDVRKIKVFSYLLIKEEPDFVMPII